MEATRRPLTESELDTLMSALLKERKERGSPALLVSDPYQTRLYLHTQSHHGNVIVFTQEGTLAGILIYTVDGLWWSKERVLFEELVLSAGAHGVQREAIKALDRLAHDFDCALIVSGCLIQGKPQMVMNGYKKAGFTIVNPLALKLCKGSDTVCSPS